MIPVKDELKTRQAPVVNYLLILINFVVFIYMYINADQMDAIVAKYALIPANLTANFGLQTLGTILTSMFMHAGWVHLIGNMAYLWIFGDNVEDRMGHFKYLIFYLAGGFAAAFIHVATDPQSVVPTVGASGAIAAVLGAYIVLFPYAQIYTIIPFGPFLKMTLLPAALVLGLWFVMQLFNGVASLSETTDVGGTAFWAHIGGFVFGVLIGFLIKAREPEESQIRRW